MQRRARRARWARGLRRKLEGDIEGEGNEYSRENGEEDGAAGGEEGE